MSVESYSDDLDLDRKFLNLSSSMANIFSWTYGMLGYRLVAPIDPNKFDNASSKAKEIAIRAMIVVGAVASLLFAALPVTMVAVVLAGGSKVCRAVAFYFQKGGFTHIRGEAREVALKKEEATVMTWNIRGRIDDHKRGVTPWRTRIDSIVGRIQEQHPDVVVLHEVYDTALVEALVKKLGGEYAHFYAHMGESTWRSGSGVMVITKCAVHKFTHTDFKEQTSKENRGFEILEIKASPQDSLPCARIVGTQITSEIGDGKGILQVVDKLAKEKFSMPTLFVGSCRFGENSGEEKALLANYLYPDRGKEATHSDQLPREWAPIYQGEEESRDFISLFKRNLFDGRSLPVVEKVSLVTSRLVEGFDPAEPSSKTALSDHHGIVTTFRWLNAH